jgi:hypothetical protein
MRYKANGTDIEGFPFANHSFASSQFPQISHYSSNSLSVPLGTFEPQAQMNKANATQPNATQPNATQPNATKPNAIQPNATKPTAPMKSAPIYESEVIAIFAIKDGKVYVIEYNGSTSNFDSNMRYAQDAIQSFSFINDYKKMTVFPAQNTTTY